MKSMYSMRSPAVKRLMKEAQELREPTELYFTQPLEDNLFEWHFTIRGPENTDFDGGLYHGRIILPPEYPMKPPNVILLTPNGRFETNKKICLSISGHHPESWQPSWSIRTALLAIIGFMPTHGGGAIGSLDYPTEERKKLVKRSLDWKCEHCGSVSSILKPVTAASKATKEEAKELATQINFRGEKQPTTDNNNPLTESTTSSTSSTPITTTPPNTPVSTNQTFPTLPTLPGQFPMPAFPFLPFANMPNFPQQQQQGSIFVPRFPYPPQFLPSMFQHMRMPLGNPYIAGNPGALQTDSAMTTTVSSSQSSTYSGLPESNVDNSTSSAYSGLGESNITSSPSSTCSGLAESNVTNSPSSPSISSSTSYAQSAPVENASMIPPAETIRSEHDSGSSATQSDTTSSAGLRQRLVDNHTPQFREDNTYFGTNAEFEPEPRRSGFRLSTLLIILLLIGIILLVLRRMYLQRMWRFPF